MSIEGYSQLPHKRMFAVDRSLPVAAYKTRQIQKCGENERPSVYAACSWLRAVPLVAELHASGVFWLVTASKLTLVAFDLCCPGFTRVEVQRAAPQNQHATAGGQWTGPGLLLVDMLCNLRNVLTLVLSWLALISWQLKLRSDAQKVSPHKFKKKL